MEIQVARHWEPFGEGYFWGPSVHTKQQGDLLLIIKAQPTT